MLSKERIKTNRLLLDDLDFWDEFTTKSISDDDTKEFFKILDSAINEKLQKTIDWLDTEEAKRYFQEDIDYRNEIFESLEEDWDEILSQEYNSADELIDNIYEHGKKKGYKDIQEKLRYNNADRYALEFAKNYNFHLIQKLDGNLRGAVHDQILQSRIVGDHPYELASKIEKLGVQPLPGSTLSAQQRAVMIARTETARVQNTGILQSYVNEGYTEVKILTAEDNHVCHLCLANAYEFNTDEIIFENRGKERVHRIADMNSSSWVPLHPNCRCTYIVVWDSRVNNIEPQVINLTPLSSLGSSIIRSNLSSNNKSNVYDVWEFNYNGIKNQLTPDEFKNRISGFVKKEDVNYLVDQLYVFQKEVKLVNIEFGLAITNRLTSSGIASSGAGNNVEFPNKFLKKAKNEGFYMVFHNHPKLNPPLPSSEDLAYFARNGIPYGIVTNQLGTSILINTKTEKNKNNQRTLEKIGRKIEETMTSDFSENTYFKIPKNPYVKMRNGEKKLTPKGEEFYMKRDKYVHEHRNEYIDLYNEKLEDYGIKVMFISN